MFLRCCSLECHIHWATKSKKNDDKYNTKARIVTVDNLGKSLGVQASGSTSKNWNYRAWFQLIRPTGSSVEIFVAAPYYELIYQENRNVTWRRRALFKYPNMVKLEQNPDHSARPLVVIWRSSPVAKSDSFSTIIALLPPCGLPPGPHFEADTSTSFWKRVELGF